MRSFEQMCEEASPANEKFRYVLALLLLQKRKLQITGNREEDGVRYLEVTGTNGEGPWDVRDLKLGEEEIEQLQLALSAQLSEDGMSAHCFEPVEDGRETLFIDLEAERSGRR